jgi:hypothetical protein
MKRTSILHGQDILLTAKPEKIHDAFEFRKNDIFLMCLKFSHSHLQLRDRPAEMVIILTRDSFNYCPLLAGLPRLDVRQDNKLRLVASENSLDPGFRQFNPNDRATVRRSHRNPV